MQKLSFLLILALSLLSTTFAQKKIAKTNTKTPPIMEKADLSMYPKPQDGYKQIVIQVPAKANENDYSVEIYIGKNELLDCNRHFMMGEVTKKSVDGFGYDYYNVTSDGKIAGTLMACPGKAPTSKFVYIAPQQVRYNSKLPLVIYIPKQLIVKYRLWRADTYLQQASTTN